MKEKICLTPEQDKYAVKIVSFGGRQTQKMWEEETKRLWEKNPSLVQTLQAFTIKEDRKLVLIQEYMDIGSLQGMLALCAERTITVPEDIISALARQMLQGLQHLHNKQLQKGARAQMHRDLKPGNILVNSKGECKLADFGTAAEVATVGQSSFIGTTLYMSPERIKYAPFLLLPLHTVYALPSHQRYVTGEVATAPQLTCGLRA